MAFKYSDAPPEPRPRRSLRPKRSSVCPNKHCLLSRLLTDELPVGALRPLSYRRGSILIEEGQPVVGGYHICRGWVKMAQRTQHGEVVALELHGLGELVGTRELLANDPIFDFYGQALEETQVVWIHGSSLLNLLDRRPDLAREVIQQFAHTAGELQRRFTHMLHASLEEQIAYLLSYLHDKQPWDDRSAHVCAFHTKLQELAAGLTSSQRGS